MISMSVSCFIRVMYHHDLCLLNDIGSSREAVHLPDQEPDVCALPHVIVQHEQHDGT